MTTKNDLLADVEYLAQTLEYATFQEFNCQRAHLFFTNHVKAVWDDFQSSFNDESTVDQVKESFPFTAYFTNKRQEAESEQLTDIFAGSEQSDIKSLLSGFWEELASIFSQVAKLSALELVRDESQRESFVRNVHSQVVFCTNAHLARNFKTYLDDAAFNFKTLVLLNAQTLTDSDALLTTALCKVDKVVLSGPLTTGREEPSILARVTKVAP